MVKPLDLDKGTAKFPPCLDVSTTFLWIEMFLELQDREELPSPFKVDASTAGFFLNLKCILALLI
jgi:hypothetical protein